MAGQACLQRNLLLRIPLQCIHVVLQWAANLEAQEGKPQKHPQHSGRSGHVASSSEIIHSQ